MRVTEALMYNRIARQTERARAQLDDASRPLMTGQAHASPSEDPTYTQRKTQVERALQRSGQYRNNIGRVTTYHQIVETTISNVTTALEDMSALAVSMASTTADAAGRKAAAANVKAVLESVQAQANAKFDGRYLFAGRLQDKPAYDANFQFQGDAAGRKVPVGDNLTVGADVTGPSVFGGGVDGSPSVFAVLQGFITALESDDTKGIQASLDSLNAIHEHAVLARSSVGDVLSQLQAADLYQEDLQYTHEKQHTELTGVDIGKAASEMAFAQQVLQAAIDTSRQITQAIGSQSGV